MHDSTRATPISQKRFKKIASYLHDMRSLIDRLQNPKIKHKMILDAKSASWFYLAMPALTHLRESSVRATFWNIPTTTLLLFCRFSELGNKMERSRLSVIRCQIFYFLLRAFNGMDNASQGPCNVSPRIIERLSSLLHRIRKIVQHIPTIMAG